MKIAFVFLVLAAQSVAPAVAQPKRETVNNQVRLANGRLEGVTEPSGVRSFKGIPYAQPPVGDLRWKEPQPARNWTGIRRADKFGPRAMQRPIFGDMNFRSDGVSEDCLYLNVWTPAKLANERPGGNGLPVLVYFYGGGFVAGDGSEPRYDGERMAQQGIVTLTVNYRLGVFGFMAHPELTNESPHRASGNYGYLDQTAALRWVQQNIAAFGGDPKRVTIAGESAGSISVSAQMASPLAKNLMAGAIGESGSLLGTLPPVSLAEAEQAGVKFAEVVGVKSLADLRAIPAEQLLEATAKPNLPRFASAIDGYFFPKSPVALFTAGEQAQVPLLVGWNSQESGYQGILGQEKPTPEAYTQAVQKLYGDRAGEVLTLYTGSTDEAAEQAATDLASDRFIGYSTWKWADLQGKTGGGKPVYRYLYARPRPAMTQEMGNATPGLAGGIIRNTDATIPKTPPARGAVHSAEIEYALGNLATNTVYAWTPDDYALSKVMQAYFANFVKTGDPNGPGLPTWSAANSGTTVQVMHLDTNTRQEPETTRPRYLFLDGLADKP